MAPDTVVPTDETVALPSGLKLAVRVSSGGPSAGGRAPFLLVHGLGSNARTWDGVGARLAASGHDVVAVDQRGHGRSAAPPDGYDTATCAADLAALCRELAWTGERSPVVAGQSWGANVALTLVAHHGGVRALALLDGGWLGLGHRFATFEECWAALAPPSFEGMRYDDVAARLRSSHSTWPPEGVAGTLANLQRLPDGGVCARLSREHHRQLLHSLWSQDPRELYGSITVPTLVLPAGSPDDAGQGARAKAAAVRELAGAIPGARIRWYPGADHDLHAQHPAPVAADLLALVDPADAA